MSVQRRAPRRPLSSSGRPRRGRPARRIGLALAGGGPLGAIYEIGALCALEEAIPGLRLNAMRGYVGVSAGAIVAAGLANGMTARQLCAAFIENDASAASDDISPLLFVQPALAEYAQRLATLPRLAATAGARMLRRALPGRTRHAGATLAGALETLGSALPTGLFSNAPLQARLAEIFSRPGRSDDFRALAHRLVLVATDLDSGESAPFGAPGWDAVPISVAATASAALPGLFPPVEIGGRFYVDGALKKTLHARVLLDEGLDLVFCLNPLVPFDAQHAPRHRVGAAGKARIPRIVDGGLPVVLSQTFRSLIHSRLELGMKGYELSHPHIDLVLIEPDQRDPEMFLANLFSYSQRRHLAEHAYRKTLDDLRARRRTLAPVLARHGLAFDRAVLADRQRRLLVAAPPPAPPAPGLPGALQRLEQVLDDLEHTLPPPDQPR